jgi:hypothetical protein
MMSTRLKVTRGPGYNPKFYVRRVASNDPRTATNPRANTLGGNYSHKAAVEQMENLAAETGEAFTRYSYADVPTQYVIRVVEYLRDGLGIADVTSDRDTIVVPVPEGTNPVPHADAVIDVVRAAVTLAKTKEQGR